MRPSLTLRRQLQQISALRRNAKTSHIKVSQPLSLACRACSKEYQPTANRTQNQKRWQSSSTVSDQPPPKEANPKIPQTHYEFFPKTLSSGPPPKGHFRIDVRELRREFLQLQAVAHPDRHPHHLKNRAEATSARINEAYKTLQNPLLRAQYLLSMRGIDVAEDETAKVDDPALLMEVLDTREEIENAEEEEQLDEMKVVNDERIRASEAVLDKAFREDDLVLAKEEAVKLRYWVNIKESLDGWEKGKPVVLVH